MTTPACRFCEADTGQHPAGTVARREKCGCDVAGIGLLPNPWHVHYCPTHAAAPEMRRKIEWVADVVEKWRDDLISDGDALYVLKEQLPTLRALLGRIDKGDK